MTNEMEFVKENVYATSSAYPTPSLRRRNLGGEILLAAIDDYRSMDETAHKDAEEFLYPQTPECQNHYDWVVGLAQGLNAAWLRDALDRFKGQWDGQRLERQTLKRLGRSRPLKRGAAG